MEYNKVSKEIFNLTKESKKLFEEAFKDKLHEIFPSAIKDGEVDFKALLEELGEYVDSNEKYELTWAGKANAKKKAQEDVVGRTLKYVPEDSKNPETTENLYIEGDNLEALKLLRNSYYNKIKMIYIDPPYNTGNDFIYNDNFLEDKLESEKAEGEVDEEGKRMIMNQKSSSRFHANWLNMMYPRLKIAKDLLTPEGVIFISIGQDEHYNLIKCCNEIFGEENCVGVISRVMKSGGGKGQFFSPNIDYILVYSRNKSLLKKFRAEVSEDTIKNYYNKIETEGDKKGKIYGEERIYVAGLDIRPNQRYWIECPDGSFVIPPGRTLPDRIIEGEKVLPQDEDGVWKWTYETYEKHKKLGNIVFKETKTSALVDQYGKQSKYNLYNKVWLEDRDGSVPGDYISDCENRQSSAELKKLDILFDFAKPVSLVKKLISYIEDTEKNMTVLDFFSGSATTAHAVMQMNSVDGGNRNFILMQLPEPTDENSQAYKAGFKNICEIGKERIRRAGEKIKEENKDKEGIENLDVGFKVFRVADTNIRWFSEALKSDNMKPLEKMEMEKDKDKLDFNEGFTDIDVVYEILLRHRDIPLSAKVEKIEAVGQRTYMFADAVLVCLEETITEDIIDSIASLEPMPMKIIFRDSAFGADISLKENTMIRLEAQIKKHSGLEKKAYRVEFI